MPATELAFLPVHQISADIAARRVSPVEVTQAFLDRIALPLEDVDQGKAPAHFTRFGNFLDLCALALPNGQGEGGLPTSLQIVCRGYDEAMALRIGWALENATEWHRRRPPG